jgi:hypothetical protein
MTDNINLIERNICFLPLQNLDTQDRCYGATAFRNVLAAATRSS